MSRVTARWLSSMRPCNEKTGLIRKSSFCIALSSATVGPVSLPADYHMHTPLCHHATGEPVDYAAQAVELSLAEIGFSDHSPMERDDFDDWRMRSDQLDSYVEKVREAQRRFPQLRIKLGLEVDYLPGHENWIHQLANRHPWDYFIGSVHYVADSWDFDNPKKLSRWKERDPFEVWSAYFTRLDVRGGIRVCFRPSDMLTWRRNSVFTQSRIARIYLMLFWRPRGQRIPPLNSTQRDCEKIAGRSIRAVGFLS